MAAAPANGLLGGEKSPEAKHEKKGSMYQGFGTHDLFIGKMAHSYDNRKEAKVRRILLKQNEKSRNGAPQAVRTGLSHLFRNQK